MNEQQSTEPSDADPEGQTTLGMLTELLVRVSMNNPLIVILFLLASILGGLVVMPWDVEGLQEAGLPHEPMDVNAMPNIGENIQIVFTPWRGRSPRDVEDQITYPLSTTLLGISNVKEVRSQSMFGLSFIYVVFEDGTDFYWARSRILEKLESLSPGTLPEGVSPSLGPESTALGQVYWYTLEARDREGNETGGWSLEERRSVQDWIVRYELMAAEGVAEVASVGGYEKQYQVDLDPNALRAHDVTIEQVSKAVQKSNLDVGAGTTEINRMEYVIRSLGYIQNLEDIRQTVITSRDDGIPITVDDVATVKEGPAPRRGMLSRGGQPSVGGVVVVSQEASPKRVIENVHEIVDRLQGGLPRKILIDEKTPKEDVKSWCKKRGFEAYLDGKINHDGFFNWMSQHPDEDLPEWITVSRLKIVPFYDRTKLIGETLNTLTDSLIYQVLITIVVILLLVGHLRSSVLISAMLPLSILITFLFMKYFDVGADIVALSGIAISIGTVVAMGIILCENILKKLRLMGDEDDPFQVVKQGATEVGGAALTAILTTLVSFLPVFYMVGVPGRMFFPLAFTKTAIMIASVVLALCALPPFAYYALAETNLNHTGRLLFGAVVVIVGVVVTAIQSWVVGLAVGVLGLYAALSPYLPEEYEGMVQKTVIGVVVCLLVYLLTRVWMPLGYAAGIWTNVFGVSVVVGGLMGGLGGLYLYYETILRVCLSLRLLFCLFLVVFIGAGFFAWQSLGEEFRPELDEGSFLYMPIMSYHGSIREAIQGIRRMDRRIESLPEVEESIGKAGRVRSPLDPAPAGMVETIVQYKSEYRKNKQGEIGRYKPASLSEGEKTQIENGHRSPFTPYPGKGYKLDGNMRPFAIDGNGTLIKDPDGLAFRQWRKQIQDRNDIWNEITRVANLPGWTKPSPLQPIKTRLLMLQTGLRAPIGMKIFGPDVQTVERVATEVEDHLRDLPSIRDETVQADRLVGKGYIEIELDRRAIARYGVPIERVQNIIETAIGGKEVTRTVEGRERYGVRLRYKRELRNSPEAMRNILVTAEDDTQVPLGQLATIQETRGPQMIRGENARSVVYVSFSQKEGVAEIDAVEEAKDQIRTLIQNDELILPSGVTYKFAGEYEQQLKAKRVFSILIPLSLMIIVIILYLQHRSMSTTLIVFSGIVVAWAGGFLLIWLYGQDGFLNVNVLGVSLQELLNIRPFNLSVAVWVGFLALFGIATDHGVLVATKLDQDFRKNPPQTPNEIHETVVNAALDRIRPQMMMVGVTVLALLPVVTSTGKGSNVMIPMALPSLGGMLFGILTILIVPILYGTVKEFEQRSGLGSTTVELISAVSLFTIPLLYNEAMKLKTFLTGGSGEGTAS